MNKNQLLSVLCAIAFSAVSFSAVADHAMPAKSDDATTNAESSKSRPGMVKPPKKTKKHKKAKKTAPTTEQKEAPAAK